MIGTERLIALGPADTERGEHAPAPQAPHLKPRRLATIYTLLCLALALPAAMLGLSLLVTWQNIWVQAEDRVGQSAGGAAEYATRLLNAHMLVVDRISEAAKGVTEAELRTGEARWHRVLQSQIARMHLALDAKLIAMDGSVLAAASAYPAPDASMATREHFTALERIPEGRIWISRAYERAGDGRRFFAISRARHLPDGGAVMVAMDEAAFGAGLARVAVRPGEIVSIIRQDGEVITRYPQMPSLPPRLPVEAKLRQEMAEGRSSGSFLSVLPATRQPVLIAYRRLVEHSTIYAVAVIPRAMIAEQWWQEVWHVLAFALLAMLALAALAWRVARQQCALLDAKAELEARVAERSAQLADEGQRLALALEANDLGFWEIDWVRGKIWRSKRLRQMLGLPAELALANYPDTFPGLHQDDATRLEESRNRIMQGEISEFQLELRFRLPSGGWGWLEAYGRVVRRHPVTGAAQIFTGVTRDITGRKEAEARRDVMIRELDHRAKNILAVIQSILWLSAKEDPARYATRVQGRIAALSRAQALLSAGAWSGGDLATILDGELTPFIGRAAPASRFTLEGPPIRLPVPAVQPLVLALHELASNAREHGAFRRPEGRVTVSWQMDEAAGLMRLFWRETGGPAVAAPASWDVGGKLMTAIIATQLRGSFAPEWREEGFTCRISVPL